MDPQLPVNHNQGTVGFFCFVLFGFGFFFGTVLAITTKHYLSYICRYVLMDNHLLDWLLELNRCNSNLNDSKERPVNIVNWELMCVKFISLLKGSLAAKNLYLKKKS